MSLTISDNGECGMASCFTMWLLVRTISETVMGGGGLFLNEFSYPGNVSWLGGHIEN